MSSTRLGAQLATGIGLTMRGVEEHGARATKRQDLFILPQGAYLMPS